MYTEKTTSGKYKYTERYRDARTGKTRRASVTLTKNTAAARRDASRILAEKIRAAQAQTDAQELTLRDAADAYIQCQAQTLKASTACSCKGRINRLCGMLGEDTLLSSLSAHYVSKIFRDSGRAPGSLNELLTRLKAWMRWCYAEDMIADIGWLDKLKPYKVDKAPERLKYMERDELQRLLPELAVPLNRLLIEFLALSGCRIGEALALTWSDISADSIRIDKTWDNNNRVTTSTKTQASCRSIHIQPELADLLRRVRLYFHGAGIRSTLVFCRADGRHIELRAIEKYFSENCQRVLGRPLHIHSLRHTHASLLFEAGMSLDAVSLRLGHADSCVTREVYLHVTERKRAEYDAQLDAVKLLG